MSGDPRAPHFLLTPSGLCLLAVACFFCLLRLGSGSLANSDDAMFASAIRQAIETGSWLEYDWFGARLDFRYPPFHLAAVRLSATLLGYTELAFRLPAALSALACVLLTGSLVANRSNNTVAGLVAGLCLCASYHFYLSTRSVGTDATLAATGTAAVWAYHRAWTGGSRWLTVTALFAGLAVLTKAVLGLVILVPIMFDLFTSGRRLLRGWHSAMAASVFIVVAGSWHVYQLAHHGSRFLDTYLLYNMVQRATSGIEGIGATTGAFWLQVVANERFLVLPWLVSIVVIALQATRDRFCRLLLVWLGAGLLPVLVSQTRLPQYLLPALPALAAICATAAARVMDRRALRIGLPIIATCVFFCGNTATWLDPDFSPGLKTLLAEAPAQSHSPTLVVYNDYHAAAQFYANRPTVLVTDDRRAHRLLRGSRAMREGAKVEYVRRSDLPARLARDRPILWLTTSGFIGRLQQQLKGLPDSIREKIQSRHRGGYWLLVEPP